MAASPSRLADEARRLGDLVATIEATLDAIEADSLAYLRGDGPLYTASDGSDAEHQHGRLAAVEAIRLALSDSSTEETP